jgi:hypothetical protein
MYSDGAEHLDLAEVWNLGTLQHAPMVLDMVAAANTDSALSVQVVHQEKSVCVCVCVCVFNLKHQSNRGWLASTFLQLLYFNFMIGKLPCLPLRACIQLLGVHCISPKDITFCCRRTCPSKQDGERAQQQAVEVVAPWG